MSFTQKKIDVQISLANGQFGSGGNSISLTGLRCQMRIRIAGGASMSQLEGAIFGMPLSQMNQLSTVGTQLTRQAKNKITVMAGDDQSGMATVYQGTLFSAFVDAQGMPQVAFRVSGNEGQYEAVKPVPPTSVKGSGDVAKMMQGLAQSMGLQFENNGVTAKLSNPYLSSSARQQVLMLARHAGIEHLIDRGTLAIWKPGEGRQGDTVMISPENGMVGYPLFNQAAIIVKTVFDPTIKYGGKIQVKSDLTPACGTWVIKNLSHDLDAQTPHGRWFSTIEATPIKSKENES